MDSNTTFKYSLKEDILNSFTHVVGFGLSIAALCVLVVLAASQGSAIKVVSFSIYGSSLIILYLSSSLYHGTRHKSARKLFHFFDHASIFLLIGGTYTPVSLVGIKGAWGWSMFGVIWGLAVIGIALKLFFTGRFKILSTIIYIIMGWMVIIAIDPLIEAMAPTGILLLALGGISYTGGTVFYIWKRLPYSHAIWHLFVLGGSILHFYSIYYYLLPQIN